MNTMTLVREGKYNRFLFFTVMFALFCLYPESSRSTPKQENLFRPQENGEGQINGFLAVFPLRNSTGNPAWNWISIGLQENLTTDLYYVSELHTKGPVNYSRYIKDHCDWATLSCVVGLSEETKAVNSFLQLSDWQAIAAKANLKQFLWGEYQLQGDDIRFDLRLYGGENWKLIDEITTTTSLEHLLQESSKQVLQFIKNQGVEVGQDEVERILSTKTELVTAWEQNAKGYWWLQNYIMSEEKQKKALAQQCEFSLRKAVVNDPHYAEAWCNLGYQRILTGDLEGAIEMFQKALDEKPYLVNAHIGIGNCLAEKGDYTNALSHLKQVVRLNPSLSDHFSTLLNTYQHAELWQEGLDTLDMLEHFLKERNREVERIDVVWWRGMFLQELHRFAESEKAYQEVLSFKEKHLGGQNSEVADIVTNLALLNKTMGKYTKAQSLFERALKINKGIYRDEHPKVAKSLSNLAELYYLQGEYSKAQPLFDRSLEIDKKYYGYEHPEVAKDLSNLAGLYFVQGNYDKAKLLYERSLAINDEFYEGQHPDVVKNLNNLAEVYRVLGEYNQANSLYLRALDICEAVYSQNHLTIALLLNNLAALNCDRGDYNQAKMFFEQALTIYENIYGPKHPHIATVLNNQAGLYYVSSEYEKAKLLYERALKIDEEFLGHYHSQVSIRLNNLAETYCAMDQYETARPLFEDSLIIAQINSQPEVLWRVHFNLAYLLAKENNPRAAIFFGKEAVNTIQRLRGDISGLEDDLQQSFLKNKWHVYKFLADLLIDQGRIPEAQQVINMQKEEEFFDFLCRDASYRNVRTTNAAYRMEEQCWSERFQKISTRIALLGHDYAELREKKKVHILTKDEVKKYQQLEDDLKVARRAFNSHLEGLIRALSIVSKEKKWEKELYMLVQLQQALKTLGNGAVAIHYLTTQDKLHIILTTPEIQLVHEVPISSRELSRNIMNFRTALQNPRRSPREHAQKLYQIVFAPIAEDLRQAKAKTLMLSLDGALRYLPIAALHDGERYVAERYLLTIYNTAAKLVIKDKPTQRWRAGGLGLSKAVLDLNALPYVPAELEGIVYKDSSDQDGVLPGVIYLDESFTREAIETVLAEEYPVMHIASHFELVPGTIQNSYLVLGNGSTLTLAEIRANGYNFGSVEILTLSSCNTAVSGAKPDGSEVESFGNLAQMHGAKGVLATLWPVMDKSTGIFMKNFYNIHETQPDITKAEALHQAQVMFIQGSAHYEERKEDTKQRKKGSLPQQESFEGKDTFIPDPALPYAHPYYWSPFILMGNWL